MIALVAGVVLCTVIEHFTARIPYAGWFLAAAVGFYGLMFQGRLIGLTYRAKWDRLGWE